MPSRTRRGVLAIAGGLAFSLGGCLGVAPPGGSMRTPVDEPSEWTTTESVERPVTESRTTESIGDRRPMERAETFVESTGDDEDPERIAIVPDDPDRSGEAYVEPTVRIWNQRPERTMDVFVRGAESGVQLDRSFEMADDEMLRLDFRGRDSYLVAVQASDGPPYGTVLNRDRFFCNKSWTNVQVDEDGVARVGRAQTRKLCSYGDADGIEVTPTESG